MRKLILSVCVLLASCVMYSCSTEDDLLSEAQTSSIVDKDEEYPDSVKESIDYLYAEAYKWDYLTEQMPADMLRPTTDTTQRLLTLLWLDDNTDEFGDTLAEGHEWEIICWYLGREY